MYNRNRIEEEAFQNISFTNLSIPQRILKINRLIKNFSSERKIDICENCRNLNGDFKKYNNFLTDGSMCSICFRTDDTLNYTIVELVEKASLTAENFYNYIDENNVVYNGLRRSISFEESQIIKKEMMLYEENKQSFLKDIKDLNDKYSLLNCFEYNKEESLLQNLKRYIEHIKFHWNNRYEHQRRMSYELERKEFDILIKKHF